MVHVIFHHLSMEEHERQDVGQSQRDLQHACEGRQGLEDYHNNV